MKEKELCALVKDLLPLYVEQLTSTDTSKLIEEHLKKCQACHSVHASMTVDIRKEDLKFTEENDRLREVDFLKKIKKNMNKKIVLSFTGALITVAIILLVKVFIYGTPTNNYTTNISIENGVIQVQGVLNNKDRVYSHYRIKETHGQKELLIYSTPSLFWDRRNRDFEIECSQELVQEEGLVISNQKVTKSNHIISLRAADIFNVKHSYIGNMSKNNELANAIGITESLGEYTSELQTSKEPYVWNFNFQIILEVSNVHIFNEKMRGYAMVILASVDNVNEITWTYKIKEGDNIEQKSAKLTSTNASKLLNENIKSFSESEERIQELLVKTGI